MRVIVGKGLSPAIPEQGFGSPGAPHPDPTLEISMRHQQGGADGVHACGAKYIFIRGLDYDLKFESEKTACGRLKWRIMRADRTHGRTFPPSWHTKWSSMCSVATVARPKSQLKTYCIPGTACVVTMSHRNAQPHVSINVAEAACYRPPRGY